ncbi:BMP family ABC transporter substrate-binding protein [Streptomyces sp. B1I3]|uniref:BMP family ABC transporter substrate-binding protein n=1 Tax=Streptomyces sp. B1I3 TaxID=3042264 RepID=UPI002788ECFD|nr:BMP family ABC transporter substrate-binding protein [Streptomyces sp. B1I3]MDQ0795938.1 basic membrane lipoprotein Med (substrate-binding protein (PBP1-ABC) superfamily) [Streptomyces sp. B1I3]
MKTRRTWRRKIPAGTGRWVPRARRLLLASQVTFRGRRGAWAAGGVLALVCALLAGWLFSGGDTASPPDARARQYRDFDACLLTGDKGIGAGTPAAPVWRGMQQASDDTRVRVTHLPVMGAQSAANALPHLNSLLQRGCEIVLAAGPAPTEVVRKAAKDHPEVRFVVVGTPGTTAGTTGGLTTVAPGAGLTDEVAGTVRRLVKNTPA